jgi:RHS repeat-associated protein
MLNRLLNLAVALLLACASTGAHGYARPLHAETARQGFEQRDDIANRAQAHVTPEAASENSPSITEASDGRRFYAKARYYGAGSGTFASVDPWEGDQLNPLSYNKYLYAYGNPGMYIDPDGRCGIAPSDFYDCEVSRAVVQGHSREQFKENTEVLAEAEYIASRDGINLGIGIGETVVEGVQASAELARDVQMAQAGNPGAQLRLYDRVGEAADVVVNPGRNYDEARAQYTVMFELRARLYREGRVDEARRLEGRMFAPVVAAFASLVRGTSLTNRVEGRPVVAGEAADGGVRFNDIDGEFGALNQPARVITGETESTRIGRQTHAAIASDRRQSGMFDVVNAPITDASGVPILVPKRIDLRTGEPAAGSPLQTANPDAVSYSRSLLIDDKPMGRPLAKDRQEIIRNMEAYRQRQGGYPEKVVIQRYDPNTGQPVVSEIYGPSDFLPRQQ